MQAVLKQQIIMLGIDTKDIVDKHSIAELVKIALPHHASYIDKSGDAGYHYLLEELEEKLLGEMQKMLLGVQADRTSLEQAAEILRLSNEIADAAQLKSMLPSNALQRALGSGAAERER